MISYYHVAAMPPPPPHGSYVNHFPNPKTNVVSVGSATPRRVATTNVTTTTPIHSAPVAGNADKNIISMPSNQRYVFLLIITYNTITILIATATVLICVAIHLSWPWGGWMAFCRRLVITKYNWNLYDFLSPWISVLRTCWDRLKVWRYEIRRRQLRLIP